ncbi:MAG: hypothetical protein H0U66_00585 [Gemmatimonadaceae bacterium]|nr:hypothetical protein [Gemmatimonadaceae bacterium]
MDLNILASLPVPARRGVFRVLAADGSCAIQSITSTGKQFMRWEMPEDFYDSEYAELMWDFLEERDPVMVLRLERGD